MAAEVSSRMRRLGGGYKDEGGEGSVKSKRDTITRDLLGGCANDLDVLKSVSGSLQHRPLQDLNLLPEDSAALDLKLVSTSADYQSVCTLDKVKLALERAALTTTSSSFLKRRRSSEGRSESPPSSSTTAEEEATAAATGLAAAGCPSCLLYVLISRGNPRCPRCGSHVPLAQVTDKKARIDLNSN